MKRSTIACYAIIFCVLLCIILIYLYAQMPNNGIIITSIVCSFIICLLCIVLLCQLDMKKMDELVEWQIGALIDDHFDL